MNIDVEQVVREYIDKTIHMSLATSDGDRPWVCEVHFVYDESLNLYFRSLKSRRHSQEISHNSNVAGNIIDKYNIGDSIVGIYFEGKAEWIPPGDGQELAAMHFRDRFGMTDEIVKEAADEEGHQFYKINVENWYAFGRFGGASGEKYKLEWNGGR